MKLCLRPLDDSALPLAAGWLKQEYVKPWFTHPQSWLDEMNGRKGAFNWIRHFIILADGIPVGFCQYYPFWQSGEDWNGNLPSQGTYSIDYLIGDARYLRMGCATEAVGCSALKSRTSGMRKG